MAPRARQPDADFVAWCGQQLHPGRGWCDALHSPDQATGPKHRIVHRDALQPPLAELQLLPPPPGPSRNHCSGHGTIGITVLSKAQQTTQPLVVPFQEHQFGPLLQIRGRLNPLPLG